MPRSLTMFCKRFGLPTPAEAITGADIAGCAARGEWDAIRQHCEDDVKLTAALAARLGIISVSEREAEPVL